MPTELEKLLKYKDNKKVLAKLEEIKHNRKLDLKQFLYTEYRAG